MNSQTPSWQTNFNLLMALKIYDDEGVEAVKKAAPSSSPRTSRGWWTAPYSWRVTRNGSAEPSISLLLRHLHFHISYLHFLCRCKSPSLWLIRPLCWRGGWAGGGEVIRGGLHLMLLLVVAPRSQVIHQWFPGRSFQGICLYVLTILKFLLIKS